MSVTPEVSRIIRLARRIVVVGLSVDPFRPSHSVAAYLVQEGYDVVGVHPGGGRVLHAPRYPDLATAVADGPIDIIDVFRRSEALAGMQEALIAARPKLVWFQLGVRDDAVARAIEAAGIPVVQDQCLAVEHRALFS